MSARWGLLIVASAMMAACGGPATVAVGREADDPHRLIACADCHNGPLSDRDMPQVPAATCTAAGCHDDGGARIVALASIEFEHRSHGGDSIAAMGCAGCHTHTEPQAPLVAAVDACSFCHIGEQAAGAAGECRLCHQNLEHAGLTSQRVAVPHEGMPWIDGGCVRCHFDVTEPLPEVSTLRCAACHTDVDAVVPAGLGPGPELHDTHTSASCVSCHEDGGHEIRAMSSAVNLACVDCHAAVHDVEVSADFPDALTCNYCHAESHAVQQRLVLGLSAELGDAFPSEKFVSGLTCRSCHQAAPGAEPTRAVRGNAQTCVACHRSEYATVNRWWREGSADRLRRITAYVQTARGRLGEGSVPAVGAALDEADGLVTLVREGRAVHNLPFAHRLLGEAADRVGQAYAAAGRAIPAAPDLGRDPDPGVCSYCHYRANDPWVFGDMSGAFHRDVMRLSGGDD